MRALLLLRTRIVYDVDAFAELLLWQLPQRLPGSKHEFKYRLAYVVDGTCVVRYDNERGKGDHRHAGEREAAYDFATVDKLLADFRKDIERWNRENGRARG